MRSWRKTWTLVGKDLATEWRTRDSLNVMLLFGVVAATIFGFAFELRLDNVRQVAPGALWVAFAFAGVLGLNRSLAREREDGCLEGLMLAPLDRGTIYVAKAVSSVLLMIGTGLVILPLFTALFGVNVLRPDLLVVLLLGTIGLAAVGTLLSAMAAHTRARDVLLPVLLLPVAVPLLIAATRATAGLLDGRGLAGVAGWLRLMVAFDATFVAISYLLFGHIVED
ncbi:MAG: heme exporter protein CcmB [Anaerolineae bacterium]|nr:heme exporter protein CcmB [Anaerolineae bacterium]